MCYSLLRQALFMLPPEVAHAVALKGLWFAEKVRLLKAPHFNPATARTVMGLHFPNVVGLAAGLDKNAEYVDALAALGFGHIEIGTVTPKPQAGNPKPRLFRLAKEEAIINRMGFNGRGVDFVMQQLKKTRYRGILGINIGKNKDTPLEQAAEDYLYCFNQLWSYASYITINISSPNTPGLRELQQGETLRHLLSTLKKAQHHIALMHHKRVPLVVKIAPDLAPDELELLAEIVLEQQLDGVIATNTTIHREEVAGARYANETGGLSGRPLADRSTAVIRTLHALLQDRVPIIGCGGIMDVAGAEAKLAAGAKLVQIYTGFIYHGPKLVHQLGGQVQSISLPTT